MSGAARRAAIVDAAARLFAEQGFSGSTREIASRLGVTQALLYRYFPSKEALVAAVFEAYRSTWDESRATLLAGAAPLAERVLAFYAAYLLRDTGYNRARLFMHAALAGIDLPLRYSPDLDARVLLPVLGALRAEVGRAAPVLPLGRDERDLVLNLHGAIVFVGIRRHVYGAVMSDARHMELVGGIIGTYLPGALAALKLSRDN